MALELIERQHVLRIDHGDVQLAPRPGRTERHGSSSPAVCRMSFTDLGIDQGRARRIEGLDTGLVGDQAGQHLLLDKAERDQHLAEKAAHPLLLGKRDTELVGADECPARSAGRRAAWVAALLTTGREEGASSGRLGTPDRLQKCRRACIRLACAAGAARLARGGRWSALHAKHATIAPEGAGPAPDP